MKPRLLASLLTLTIAPLLLLGWLGHSLTNTERTRREKQLQTILVSRLQDIDSRIAKVIEARERDVIRLADTDLRPQVVTAGPQGASVPVDRTNTAYRAASRTNGYARRFFLLDNSGNLVYPSPYDPTLTAGERAFLQRTSRIWIDKALPFAAQADATVPEVNHSANLPPAQQRQTKMYRKSVTPQAEQQDSSPAHTDRGWHTWYWEDGLDLLFWYRVGDGFIVGAELNRARLLADIIAELPESVPGETGAERISLHNASGDLLYGWGQYDPPSTVAPVASLPLSSPLSSWSLRYDMAPRAFDRAVGGGTASMLGALAALGVTLLILGIVVYRESTRAMREAGQRVSFVNQVSHELKTPLTNIRMYAELLGRRLPEEDVKAKHHLDVVVNESERLTRLINNVLTFGREERGKLTLRTNDLLPDESVGAILLRLKPMLDEKGITIRFSPGAPGTMQIDSDVLEQILVNLASNVEKYGSSGGEMNVQTKREGSVLVLTVADNGPGIPPAHRERIFTPFHRVSDKLTEGVAGTGIGLSIARSLARLHGGDLRLLPSRTGACFEVRLKTTAIGEST